MKELVGKTVLTIEVSEDQGAMRICTDSDVFVYVTDADCCSETWFADIIGFDALIGNEIRSVREDDIKEADDDRTRQEYDQIYGFTIHTDKGACNIVFRNSSNGYYGGSVELYPTRYHSPGLIENSIWTQITDDWSA